MWCLNWILGKIYQFLLNSFVLIKSPLFLQYSCISVVFRMLVWSLIILVSHSSFMKLFANHDSFWNIVQLLKNYWGLILLKLVLNLHYKWYYHWNVILILCFFTNIFNNFTAFLISSIIFTLSNNEWIAFTFFTFPFLFDFR